MKHSPHHDALSVLALGVTLLSVAPAHAAAPQPPPEQVTFATQDGGLLHGDLYGTSGRAVVLAHGGRFDKSSWEPQARILMAAGFRVLAFDFRGYGASRGPGDSDPLSAPLHLDLLAAARFLKARGATSVSAVGASMGGTAASDAAIESAPGTLDRVVVLAAAPSRPPERFAVPKLFIIARDDPTAGGTPRLVRIRELFERTPPPRELVILEGEAHAQFLFKTDQGDRLMREIVRFLSDAGKPEEKGR